MVTSTKLKKNTDGATVFETKLFVLGGFSDVSESLMTQSSEVYDGITNQFTYVKEMMFPTGFIAVTVSVNLIYCFCTTVRNNYVTNRVQIYDTVGKVWSSGEEDMATNFNGVSAATITPRMEKKEKITVAGHSTSQIFVHKCGNCGRLCGSRIGHYSHQRACKKTNL